MLKHIQSKGASETKVVQDVRKALDDKDLDAISIATPNHWHSLMTIWACQAGKDVYVEKPLSHNIHEGRLAVDAARKYKRIVQHGTQSRSEGESPRAIAAIHSGKLGKLLLARGLCYKSGGGLATRGDIGFAEAQAPPATLDFDLWLGPAPKQSYHKNLVPYRWHWFWDFGNGDIGNQGVHQIDVGRWGIKGATLPKSVICVGGRFGPADQGQTANTQIAIFDYGHTQLIFEVRGLKSEPYGKCRNGSDNVFVLEKGTIASGRFYPKGSNEPEPLPDVPVKFGPGKGPFGNFIAAVRSRKHTDLNADVLEGHYSAALCHLANASYRLGEKVPFNKKTKASGDNKEAYEALARMEEHLTSNGIFSKLAETDYLLGRKLTINPESESLTDDKNANDLLAGRKQYREPFVLPVKLA